MGAGDIFARISWFTVQFRRHTRIFDTFRIDIYKVIVFPILALLINLLAGVDE